jgi:hypothetical protein
VIGAHVLLRHRQAQLVPVDRENHLPRPDKPDGVAADSAAQVRHAGVGGESPRPILGDRFAGRLFECLAGEIHLPGAGELLLRLLAEEHRFQGCLHQIGGMSFAQPLDAGNEAGRCRVQQRGFGQERLPGGRE